MTRPRRHFDLPPRGMTREEVSEYHGHGAGWYDADRQRELEALGHPAPDPITGRWDHHAIDFWWDRRSGIAAAIVDDGITDRLEAMRNGQG